LTSQFHDISHDVISRRKLLHLVSEHETSGQRQFVIYSTFVLVLYCKCNTLHHTTPSKQAD